MPNSKFSDFYEQGTALSGFEAKGPYHCEDCIHLKGNVCVHPVVKVDPQLKSRKVSGGIQIINADKECCKFVKIGVRKEKQ